MKLEIDKTADMIIYARERWNFTNIEISKGEEYEFNTAGTWKDAHIETDANGYTYWLLRLATLFRRAKKFKWFALTGSLNQGKEYFLIGKKNNIYFAHSGSLYCFANDVNGFYCNNHGYITLKITRLK